MVRVRVGTRVIIYMYKNRHNDRNARKCVCAYVLVCKRMFEVRKFFILMLLSNEILV